MRLIVVYLGELLELKSIESLQKIRSDCVYRRELRILYGEEEMKAAHKCKEIRGKIGENKGKK